MFVSVLLDSAIDKSLDYSVPEALKDQVEPGVRVLVPVRQALRKATILKIKETAEVAKVQPIAEILSDKSLINEELFGLARWMAQYYATPLRRVLKSILPATIRKDLKHKEQLFIKPLLSKNEMIAFCEKNRNTHASQAQVIDVLLQSPKGMLLSELMEKGDVSRSPIDTLVKKKILSICPLTIDRSPLQSQEFFITKPKKLTEEQAVALKKIQESLGDNRFETHLIYGVTGSGKTEIYLQAIDTALQQNKTVIFLVPEIALTSQTLERLKSRFENKIAILHHRLSDGERRDIWHNIHSGECRIIVGARSAVFSPVSNLGLIIVDEEHESSYKQSEEMPCYHARDIAVVRGKLCKATVVLGSATPSFESYQNALNGKYNLSKLTVRPTAASLPTFTLVDMRTEFERAKGFTLFSDRLLEGIKKRVEKGEQTLLFLNRRGYHTSQVCVGCAAAVQCPHCDISLTYHQGDRILSCHLCDYRLSPPPKTCPSCGDEHIKFKGAGTELVEKSLHAILPDIRTLRLDADTTKHKGQHEKVFKQFRSGKADVLIGTQMVAKGLHFPLVTLVGILNADASLNIPDFRASEFVFQLITQVAGRAGRGELKGEVIVQTQLPTHETITFGARQDYEMFFNKEIEARKLFLFPPFSHLLKLTFSGEAQEKTLKIAKSVRARLIEQLPASFEIHPVIPSGHAKVKDQYRFQILIKGQKLFPPLRLPENLPSDIKLQIDVDPVSTYF